MKSLILKLTILISITIYSHNIHAQFKVRNDAAIQIGYSGYRYLTFGQETNSPNNGKFALEYMADPTTPGFNIWKPWPTAGAANFLLFIRNNGNIGVGNNGDATVKFQVSGTARANSWLTFSDRRLKTDITPLENSLAKVLKLNGVNYRYKYEFDKNPNGISDTEQVKVKTAEVDSKITSTDDMRLGLIAQDVKEILPEVVREDEKGYLSINYSDIVPLLIESIKQQQKQIEEMKKAMAYTSIDKKDPSNTSSKSYLEQNTPNPFDSKTTIPYTINEVQEIATAKVNVYDKDGNLYSTNTIEPKNGSGKIEIDCNNCKLGIYVYTLQINDKIVDTKMMILVR